MIKIVHVGAGRHSIDDERPLKKVIRNSLSNTDQIFLNEDKWTQFINTHNLLHRCRIPSTGTNLLKQLFITSREVEQSTFTNTGLGSSVTTKGTVECDSSILITTNGKRYQTASCCNTSSQLPMTSSIEDIINQNSHSVSKLGLTNPIFMVKDRDGIPNDGLVTDRIKNLYDRLLPRLNDMADGDIYPADLPPGVVDTIGVTIIDTDQDGHVSTCSGVSSGGSFFKTCGRVGCAAVIGAGTYTLSKIEEGITINCMSSGNGEDIIQMDLSRFICNYLYEKRQLIIDGDLMSCDAVVEAIKAVSEEVDLRAIDSNYKNVIYVGCLGYIKFEKGLELVFYAHSTESFIFGFQDRLGKREVVCSRNRNTGGFSMGEFMLNKK